MATKIVCPISREEFHKNAGDLVVSIDGVTRHAAPREFSTGSLGWSINEKVALQLGDKRVVCQVGMNITVVGSRDAK